MANLNPAIYVKNSAGMNPLLGQVLLKLCEPVSEKELEQIPPLTENSANFQVVIRGVCNDCIFWVISSIAKDAS